MGNSPSKADVELPRKEPLTSELSPKPPAPYVGVLLEGIATGCISTKDASKKQAQQMFQDLGLGRGIDATAVQPWLNRTALQVRPVLFDNLIGTEEGGYLEEYMETSFSSHTLQLEMKGEVGVPTNGTAPVSPKVKIGVGSDYMRTISTERCVFGRRVVNRTISFRENIQDLPFSPGFTSTTPLQPGAEGLNQGEAAFEEELCKWILERYQCPKCRKGEQCKDRKENKHHQQPPINRFAEWFQNYELHPRKSGAKLEVTDESVAEWINRLCLQFVRHLNVTHYVSAIKLGATESIALAQSESMKKVNVSGSSGLDDFITTRSMASKISRRSKRKYEHRAIGTIVGEGKSAHVPRSVEKEAVIEVEFMPIYTLVRHPFLAKFLKDAVQTYISEQTDPRSELSIYRSIACTQVQHKLYNISDLS